MPQFTYYSGKEFKLCFSKKKALELWTNCKEKSQMLQKFIIPPKRTPTKIRIYWTAPEGPKYYLINALTYFPKSKTIKDNGIKNRLPTKYQHSISDYPYAGQILRSSFNSFLPERSKIKSLSGDNFENMKFCYKKDLYLSKSIKDNISVMNEDNVPESIKNMMDTLISMINYSKGRYDKKVITELLVDFIPDEFDHFYLFKCRGHKYDYLATKPQKNSPISTFSYHKSILNTQFARGFFDTMLEKQRQISMQSLSINSFAARLEKLKLNNHTSCQKISGLNMTDSIQLVISNYLENPPIIETSEVSLENNKIFESVIKNLDDRVSSVRNYKRKYNKSNEF